MFFKFFQSLFTKNPPPHEVKDMLDSWYHHIKSEAAEIRSCGVTWQRRESSQDLIPYCNRFIRVAKKYEGFDHEIHEIKELRKALKVFRGFFSY